jgi:hypothetical protein
MTLRSEYKRDLNKMNVFHVCVIVSVSVKAVTGMRVENRKGVRHFYDSAIASRGPVPMRPKFV